MSKWTYRIERFFRTLFQIISSDLYTFWIENRKSIFELFLIIIFIIVAIIFLFAAGFISYVFGIQFLLNLIIFIAVAGTIFSIVGYYLKRTISKMSEIKRKNHG